MLISTNYSACPPLLQKRYTCLLSTARTDFGYRRIFKPSKEFKRLCSRWKVPLQSQSPILAKTTLSCIRYTNNGIVPDWNSRKNLLIATRWLLWITETCRRFLFQRYASFLLWSAAFLLCLRSASSVNHFLRYRWILRLRSAFAMNFESVPRASSVVSSCFLSRKVQTAFSWILFSREVLMS